MQYFKKTLFTIVFIFFAINISFSNDIEKNVDNSRELRIMFYNVENLFDTFDDSLTLDEEYLPTSDKHWTIKKYNSKIKNIYKVIAAIGGYEPPDIIALCEVENKKVLLDLIQNTPLSKYPYQIIHKESPDARGIDVAILYRKDKLDFLAQEFIQIKNPKNSKFKTRDIVYLQALSGHSDTIHVFANHWPSRRGGQSKSEPKRVLVASILRNKVDSILNSNVNSKIIITGDFNDDPFNKSISEILISNDTSNKKNTLVNLSFELQENCNCGTLKYEGNWNMFDQFIISKALLNNTNSLKTSAADLHIYNVDFLLEDDTYFFGDKPFRTYNGYRYLDGFSDHLPVYLDLY